MGSNNTKSVALHSAAWTSTQLFHDWFDPIEVGVRDRVRSFIEGMIEAELETALSRPRYGRPTKTRDEADNVLAGLIGHRHGHRPRSLLGTFGQVKISVPRARLMTADGKTREWRSKTLPAYQRRARHQCGPECLVGCRPRIRPGRNRPTNHRAPVAGRSTHARTHIRCWLRQHQAPQECQDTEAVKANPEVVKANLKVARTRPRASAPGR